MEGVGDLSVRFVDCVGYMVEGALGADEEGTQRMVRTPWFEKEIPFAQAAEVGTDKVIGEHSTIGILVTTDGSFSGIDRLGYVEAEEKAVSALKRSGKPFVLVLNSAAPDSPEARRLAEDLTEKYDVPALLLDVLHLTQEDLASLLRTRALRVPPARGHRGPAHRGSRPCPRTRTCPRRSFRPCSRADRTLRTSATSTA